MTLRKRLLFASIAVLLFFGGLELGLALFGVEPLISGIDPFQGFSDRVRVYELDAERGVYFSPRRAVAHSFNYQEFAAAKPDNGLRIFVLGGSSAYGFPWGAQVAFPAVLGRALQSVREDRLVESINAAAMSYGSHRLRVLTPELLSHDPDLLVIYGGHNEFVERSFYRDMLERPQRLDPFRALIHEWRTYSVVARGFRSLATQEQREGRTTAELLGLDVDREYATDVDEPQRAEARDRFEENLHAILELARAEKVPVLLCTVPSNLRGWRPNQSAFGRESTAEERLRAESLLERGRGDLERQQAAAAAETLERAAAVAPRHAGIRFFLGQAYLQLDRPGEARSALSAARDLDARPSRAIGSFNETLRSLAADEGVLLADIEHLFEERAAKGIPGFDLFEDYVHPNPRGHRLIAMEIWRTLLASGFGGPAIKMEESDFWQGLGLEGEPEPAADAALDAVSAQTAPLLYNLAVVLENQGLEDQAIQRYLQCLELDPGYYVARANLGRLLYRAGRFARSAEEYRLALQADPRHTASWIGMGEALSALSRTEAAVQALARATELEPQSAHAWHSLALSLSKANRNEEAEGAFRRAETLDPHNTEVRTNLGFSLLVQGKLEEAERVFRDNLERDATHLRSRNGLAAVLTETGGLDEAERIFRGVLATDPENPFAAVGLQKVKQRR